MIAKGEEKITSAVHWPWGSRLQEGTAPPSFAILNSVEFFHGWPELPQVLIQPAAKPDREMFIPA